MSRARTSDANAPKHAADRVNAQFIIIVVIKRPLAGARRVSVNFGKRDRSIYETRSAENSDGTDRVRAVCRRTVSAALPRRLRAFFRHVVKMKIKNYVFVRGGGQTDSGIPGERVTIWTVVGIRT